MAAVTVVACTWTPIASLSVSGVPLTAPVPMTVIPAPTAPPEPLPVPTAAAGATSEVPTVRPLPETSDVWPPHRYPAPRQSRATPPTAPALSAVIFDMPSGRRIHPATLHRPSIRPQSY